MKEFEEQQPLLPIKRGGEQQQQGVRLEDLEVRVRGIRRITPEHAKRRMDKFLRDIR